MKFSDKLRSLRLSRQISLSDLAKRSGVNKGYLSSLETGRQSNPSRSKLQAICKHLGVELNYFSDEYNPEKVTRSKDLPPGLQEFVEERKREKNPVDPPDIDDLSRIKFRGEDSFSARDYAIFYSNLELIWKNKVKDDKKKG